MAEAQGFEPLKFLQLTNELPKELGKYFAANAQTMPQSQLGQGLDGWRLESQVSSGLRAKLVKGRKTLKEVYGSPLYGIKTGLNEAFVLTRKERDDLIAAQPKCNGLFKPFLRGEDLKKWRTESQDLWLLRIARGDTLSMMRCTSKVSEIDAWNWFSHEFPVVANWLKPFESAARKRSDQGDYWWELRACAYYELFEAPKIIYPDLAQGSKFSSDKGGNYFGNTGYFLPNPNDALLPILNSKVVWFYLRGVCEAMRGGEWRLRMFSQNIETIPIPESTEKQRDQLGRLAAEAQSAAEARRDVIQQFGRMVHRDFGKPPAGLVQSVPAFADFTAALKKTFKRELSLQEKNDWEAMLDKARGACALQTNTIAACEQAIDKIVYQLFELTSDEIAVVEGGA
ncbi:MAG: hypothetical protein RLY95_1128 [Pseudomonadota bacterium]